MSSDDISTEDDWVRILKAIADPTRLQLLRALLDEPRTVNQLSADLGVSQYNVSKHLRVLRDSGLLIPRKLGTKRLYGLSRGLHERLAQNQNVLDLGCCEFRFDRLPRPVN